MSDPTSNARPPATPASDDGVDALPAGTRLAEFEIRQVLGTGGFGIVYRAWDEALQRDVALKEYMPVTLAGRGAGERVTLRSRTQEESFALGLQSFVNEARLLARFDEPALVKVFRFWEANGTAYMAMPLYKGRTLRQLRREIAPGTLDDAWARALIEPLLGALQVMHDAAVYHRDIAPDNILWCDDNRPVLLDFGAARLVLADRTQNVTAVLKPQFAPIEQYAETPSMRQGPWTDLYALAGTCYFMLTGRAPLPATARVMSDEMAPLVRLAPPGCSPALLQTLDWAMAVRPQDRPQSVAQFRAALAGQMPVPPRAGANAPAATAGAVPASSDYEKTIQATMRTPPTRRAPAPDASGAAAARRGHEDDLETPERSVLLPPKSRSPLALLLLMLVVAAAAAGAWTTRQQWLPALGLRPALLPAAPPASAAEAAASATASMPVVVAASAVVAEAASAAASDASPVAGAAAPSAAAAPAPVASLAVAEAETPPSHPAPSKSSRESVRESRSKALAARIAALTLPPPVLPPENESHVTAARSVGNAPAESGEPPALASAPAAPRDVGPREVCADQGPAKTAACIKRLCDTYPRYQRYPICQRVQRREGQQ